jgi:hypothetical protein
MLYVRYLTIQGNALMGTLSRKASAAHSFRHFWQEIFVVGFLAVIWLCVAAFSFRRERFLWNDRT